MFIMVLLEGQSDSPHILSLQIGNDLPFDQTVTSVGPTLLEPSLVLTRKNQ